MLSFLSHKITEGRYQGIPSEVNQQMQSIPNCHERSDLSKRHHSVITVQWSVKLWSLFTSPHSPAPPTHLGQSGSPDEEYWQNKPKTTPNGFLFSKLVYSGAFHGKRLKEWKKCRLRILQLVPVLISYKSYSSQPIYGNCCFPNTLSPDLNLIAH